MEDNINSKSYSVGEALIQEREKRKISLEEISRLTNISIKSLMALESENFTDIPGEFYFKNYIKSYLKAIGCSESEFNKKYQIKTNTTQWSSNFKRGNYLSTLRYSRFKKKNIFITGFILFIIVGTITFVLLYQAKTNFFGASPHISIIPETVLPSLPVVSEYSMDRSPLKIEIEFLDNCWIQVFRGQKNHRKKFIEQVFKKGENIKLKGYELFFIIGNPSVLRFIVNQKEVKFLKNITKAEKFLLTPQNLEDFFKNDRI